jgi:Type I phosphodiesterase / nucleotide pyrophosphatase
MSKHLGFGLVAAALSLLALALAMRVSAGPRPPQGNGGQTVRHVLLISIDGMHALDFINCANAIKGANGGAPYCLDLAGLKSTSIDYLYAYTSEPSDSFPGLMALVTGGSPGSVGAFRSPRTASLASARFSGVRALRKFTMRRGYRPWAIPAPRISW